MGDVFLVFGQDRCRSRDSTVVEETDRQLVIDMLNLERSRYYRQMYPIVQTQAMKIYHAMQTNATTSVNMSRA